MIGVLYKNKIAHTCELNTIYLNSTICFRVTLNKLLFQRIQ